jgi:hypothetical protein
MKLNDLFDCVYYINLNKRIDRKNKFWQLNKNILDIERTIRITAFDASNQKNNTDFTSIINARTAISLSYTQPFLHAVKNNFNQILIFEDDAEPFFTDASLINKYLTDANELNYEIMFLGGTVQSPLDRASANLFNLKGNILATQAVCFNNRNSIFNQFSQFPSSFENMRNFLLLNNGCCMDTIIGKKMTQQRTSFVTDKLLFGQYESFSDIEAETTSYNKDMINRFLKFANNQT